ncbi:MAG TPA: hypothetical protein VFD00_02200 [Thermoclostridium sp.]|nr:hypothetical protein [Thermoclostridium sp.]
MTPIREITADINIDRLAEICEAEREGRLVVLPCKVGDTVYTLEERCGNEWVEDINCGFCDIGLYGNKDTCCKELAVRKTVVEDPFNFKYSDDMYTSQREAEKALAEMETNNENNND